MSHVATWSETQIRLPRTYDVPLLEQDLAAVRYIQAAPQPGPHHDGEWKGISLYAQGGRQSSDAPQAGLDPYLPTDALKCAPYFSKILNELQCPKMSVRLLSLTPGAEIGEHYDARTNFFCGMLRLHLPIITHRDVEFVINDERCFWKPGELWYGDFSMLHRVINRSPITRTHMVIDVEINDYVLDLFPHAFVQKKQGEGPGIALARNRFVSDRPTLERFACAFRIPGEIMPLFGGGRGMRSLASGATAVLRPCNDRLIASLDNMPSFALERVGEMDFNIVGLSSGCSFEFTLDTSSVAGVSLRLRGLPEDLYAAQLGCKDGPLILDRSVALPIMKS